MKRAMNSAKWLSATAAENSRAPRPPHHAAVVEQFDDHHRNFTLGSGRISQVAALTIDHLQKWRGVFGPAPLFTHCLLKQ